MNPTKTKDPAAYNAWKAFHECSINHKGSSGAKEIIGAQMIFKRSVEKHNLYYTSFYGDGDSKLYSSVKNICGTKKDVTK